MSKKKNKEAIVRDIYTIACASAMIPLSIALAFIGKYECALLGIILVRLMLMGRSKNENRDEGNATRRV